MRTRRKLVARAAADAACLAVAVAARRRWQAAGWAVVLAWDVRAALA